MDNKTYIRKGTKVLTKRGYIPIEELTTTDYILTHENEFVKVQKIVHNEEVEFMSIKYNDKQIFVSTNQKLVVSEKKKGIYMQYTKKPCYKVTTKDSLVSLLDKNGSSHVYFQYFDIVGINKEIIKDEGYNIKLFSQHTVMIEDILVSTLKEI